MGNGTHLQCASSNTPTFWLKLWSLRMTPLEIYSAMSCYPRGPSISLVYSAVLDRSDLLTNFIIFPFREEEVAAASLAYQSELLMLVLAEHSNALKFHHHQDIVAPLPSSKILVGRVALSHRHQRPSTVGNIFCVPPVTRMHIGWTLMI